MFKITAIVSLMLIATWSHADVRRNKKEGSPSSDFDSGSTLWAASLSCDSCGSECAAACGTRHFRSCCFNYLRRKRGPERFKLLSKNLHDAMPASVQRPKSPTYLVDDIPEPWTNLLTNDYNPYIYDENVENRMQLVYDV